MGVRAADGRPTAAFFLSSLVDKRAWQGQLAWAEVGDHVHSDGRCLLPVWHGASGEEVNHGPVERRDIAGLAAGHPIVVLHDFLI